jgi:uncharacterized protein HemY
MHPIVILFLLFVALGAGYFLWATKSALVLGPLAALRTQFGLSDGVVVKIVIALVVLFVLYQIYGMIRTANLNRQANKRMRDSVR